MRYRFVQFLLRHLGAFCVIALTTLLLRPFQAFLQIQIIALIYLLPVMVSTVLWGLTPGVLAGFLAFLAFNYFYIPPYYTFAVHATQDLITLLIFLVVTVVMSQLIGQAREGVHLARSREWEATRMYELISALAGLQDAQKIAETLAAHTLETFHCEQVEVFVDKRKDEDSLIVTMPGAAVPEGTRVSEGIEPPAGGAQISPAASRSPATRIPLMTARGVEGEMRLWLQQPVLPGQTRLLWQHWLPRLPFLPPNLPPPLLSPGEKRLLEAYSSQGALAIERVRLSRGETRTRVLEESDRLKSALLNSVSHELRSPLAAIKASVSSLRSGAVDWDTAAREDLLATIEEETDHLNLLVGNLLDMSRIESGALQPHKRWNAIAEIAQGVANKMRKQLQDHRLVLDFPPHLPLVPTDYVMIEQVFSNLMSNSIKFSPSGTLITISARKEADTLHVQVINQGPPVAEEHLEQIFDKFHRVTAADRVTGTGLGLSICKGIIEAHGGQIWAENQPCCFVFHFVLPLTLDGALPSIPEEVGNG